MGRSVAHMPLAVTRALRQLGGDLRAARLRRRLRTQIVAERAQISLPTLLRIEKGEPSVSLGHYATVLWVLGLLAPLNDIASLSHDQTGLALEDETLPQRIREPKRKQP
jgi:transcriptional regulator with XRE-family HTH domain